MSTVWCVILVTASTVVSIMTGTSGDWRLEYPPWGEIDAATYGSPKVWFPMIIPFTRHGCGPSRYMSMRIAVNHINRRDSTFCPAIGDLRNKFELQYDIADSNANGRIAVKGVYKFISNGSVKVKVVLGPNSSGSSQAMSNILAVLNIAHMSWAATSSKLSNKDEYPMFFRVVPPDSLAMKVLAGWIHHLKFKVTNLAFFDGTYQSGQASNFKQAAKRHYGLEVNEFKMASSGSGGVAISDENMIEVKSVLREILYTRIRVVVVLAVNEEAYDFFRAVHDMQMMSESGWLWCGGDGLSTGMVAGRQERIRYFEGIVFLLADSLDDTFNAFRAKWAELMPNTRRPEFENFKLCHNETDEKEVVCSKLPEFIGWQDGKHDVELVCTGYTALAYDAVVTLAVVADKMISKGKDISQVSNKDWLEEMRALSTSGDSYECLTGSISFNKNQERDMGMALYNWQDTMEPPLVMTWDGINGYQWKTGATVVWPGSKPETVIDSAGVTVPTGLPPTCEDSFQIYNLTSRMCEACPEGNVYLEAVRLCACKSGYFRNETLGTCSACAPGSFSRGVGAAMCRACPPGQFSSEAASTQCTDCRQGEYQEKTGMSACSHCQDTLITEGHLRLTTQMMGAKRQSDCVCKAGTYMNCATQMCVQCSEGLFCPTAGLVWGSCSEKCSDMAGEAQSTPMLETGYMSEAGSPLSILTCVGTRSCAAPRCLPVFEHTSKACNGSAQGPRCAQCPGGWYMTSDYECKDCSLLEGGGRVARIGLIFLFQFLTFSWTYMKEVRGYKESEHVRMLKTLIPFVQQILAFQSLELKQPDFFRAPDWTREVLSFTGLFEFLELPDGCVGTLQLVIVRNACLPLVPLVDFAIISLICLIRRKRPSLDSFINIYLGLLCDLFVSLARMGVVMFPRSVMPNGDYYLTEFPSIKFGSEEWMQAGPLSVTICLLYCVTVTAYIMYSVVVMPRKAASDPAFVLRHDFMIDSVRCQRWWWILVEILFAIAIALVQTLIVTVFFQVNMLIFCVVFMLVALFRFRPYEHISVNWIHISLKVTLLCILVSMTGMIDYEKTPLEYDESTFGLICVSAFCAAVAGVLCATSMQIAKLWVPEASRYGRSIKLAYQLRDIMQIINLLPEKEFLARIHGLGDSERQAFKEAMGAFISVFLKEQPSRWLWRQRIIENVPFKVWSPHDTTVKALRAMSSGEAERACARSAQIRIHLHKLIYGIHQSKHRISKRHLLDKLSNDALNCEEMDKDFFVEHFEGLYGLSSANLSDLFELLDTDCNGTVSRAEMVSAAQGLVYEDFDEEEISCEQSFRIEQVSATPDAKVDSEHYAQEHSEFLQMSSPISPQISPTCENVSPQSLFMSDEMHPVSPRPSAKVEPKFLSCTALEQGSLSL